MGEVPGFTVPAARLPAERRAAFMGRVYARLLAATALFVGLEWFLFTSGLAETLLVLVSSVSWLLILGGFMLVSWLANSLAFRSSSPAGSAAGLVLLVSANALLFAPLLLVAEVSYPGLLAEAAQYTLTGFLVLSWIAHRSSRDFAWLGAVLRWVALLALGGIVLSVLTGFQLGTWFALGMVGFAGAAILHDTQRMLQVMPEGRETQAAMLLFSSVALMFWYIVQIMVAARR